MKYNLDLERLSLQEYKDLLKQQNLLPGRRILWQDIDKNFALLESKGVKSAADLKKSLSTSKKIEVFATESGITEEYLVILKREIGSLEQKPVPLSAFPDINSSVLEKLAETITTIRRNWELKICNFVLILLRCLTNMLSDIQVSH